MLAEDLKAQIQGEVRFDDGSRALYATDASNYRQVPLGVITPRTEQDVLRAVEVCRRHNVPILARGAGTSLAGQGCNVAVVFDFSRHLNKIIAIDPVKQRARVQPGVVLDHLRRKAESFGLTFGPDPATHSHCTLGGMIGNNSCGVHALLAGKTVDNVESLKILTYEGHVMEVGPTSEAELEEIIRGGDHRGQIYAQLKALRDRYADLIRARFPKIPRRVSGYNLDELLPENGFHVARALVGSEGTCVNILEATLRLVPWPSHRTLLVIGYPNVYQAAAAVPSLLHFKPQGLEGFDDEMLINMRKDSRHAKRLALLPPGGAWLLVEFGGTSQEETDTKARQIPGVFFGPEQAQEVWTIRESALAATAIIPGQRDRYEGWEDAAVPPEKLSIYLRDLRALYNRYGYHGAFYGHFGQGCVHTRIDFDLDTPDGIRRFRSFVDEAADLVVRCGGSISGEHGDGQARAELLPKMFGPELVQAFQEFKGIWDPDHRMNPGKIVEPDRITDHLRFGLAFRPAKVETHFQFPSDGGQLSRAVFRCVGVGKCRSDEGGVMCPSWRATQEEKHSTRGRARLLFEMLKGETLPGLWKNEAVKEALDLCLACKGCKNDCPMSVDMASYKAEFLSHYYQGRLRPRQSYAFGLVYWWARLGSLAPNLANFFTQTSGLGRLAKFLAGMAPERSIPTLAPHSFRSWFKKGRHTPLSTRPTVVLWPDTFTNYFEPGPGRAAVEVLERLGYKVEIPKQSLCCGRPLYDYGFLDLAKRLLVKAMKVLQPYIQAGTPILFLEPSCASVFRDELMNLFPKDPLAKKLSQQTYMLGEFLVLKHSSPAEGGRGEVRARWLSPPSPIPLPPKGGEELLKGKSAIVQGHCHHRSVLDWESEMTLLRNLGLEIQVPEPGCCGMAGAFGFESDHAGLSKTVGEQKLLPAIRESSPDTWVIADGFSCREQIRQGTGRRVLHLAEILRSQIGRA